MAQASIYRRFQCAFVRTQAGALISCSGPSRQLVEEHWDAISPSICDGFEVASGRPPSSSSSSSYSFPSPLGHCLSASSPSTTVPSSPIPFRSSSASLLSLSGASSPSTPATSVFTPPSLRPTVHKSTVQLDQVSPQRLVVYQRQGEVKFDMVIGLLLDSAQEENMVFEELFVSSLLKSIMPFTSVPHPTSWSPARSLDGITDAIVSLFDVRLRYKTDHDKWEAQGRAYFRRTVNEFVRRNERVEFCLPAFPCKSSNLDKVGGTMPDRGEQLALEHLHSFVESIERIYEPGAKVWIISDGHVFSDCIGVDDGTVDAYNAQLIDMNAAIGRQRGSADRLAFKSLIDLFDLESAAGPEAKTAALGLAMLPSHIATARTAAAEASRALLMRGCATGAEVLRAQLTATTTPAPPIVALYRGFSRFMLEDLATNPYTRARSRSQQRKLAARVAFDMLLRNEAYSNLVELAFPHHVRLSIHAHDNSGPKFGIRLFGRDVRACDTLTPATGTDADAVAVSLLHVPTPWHNSVVEIAGRQTLIMTKAKTVRDALASGRFRGGWVEGVPGDIAGRFCLTVVEPSEPIPAPIATTRQLPERKAYRHLDKVSSEALDGAYSLALVSDADLMYHRECLGIF